MSISSISLIILTIIISVCYFILINMIKITSMQIFFILFSLQFTYFETMVAVYEDLELGNFHIRLTIWPLQEHSHYIGVTFWHHLCCFILFYLSMTFHLWFHGVRLNVIFFKIFCAFIFKIYNILISHTLSLPFYQFLHSYALYRSICLYSL